MGWGLAGQLTCVAALLFCGCLQPTLDRDCACTIGDACVALHTDTLAKSPPDGVVVGATADGEFVLVQLKNDTAVFGFASGEEVPELRHALALGGTADSLVAILEGESRQLLLGVLRSKEAPGFIPVPTTSPATSLSAIARAQDGRQEIASHVGTDEQFAHLCPGSCNLNFLTHEPEAGITHEFLPVGTLTPQTVISTVDRHGTQTTATWTGHCKPLTSTADGLFANCVRPSRLALNDQAILPTEGPVNSAFATHNRIGWIYRDARPRLTVATVDLERPGDQPIVSYTEELGEPIEVTRVVGTTQGPIVSHHNHASGLDGARLHCIGREDDN